MSYFPPGAGDQPQGPGYQQQPGYQPQGPGYPQPGYPPQPPGYPWQAPGYAQPPMRKVRPGRIWYLATLAVLVAGIAWLAYGLASVAGTIDNLQRVSLPGGGTVNLTHGGGYTIYYEGPGADSGSIAPFHINVAPASPGAAVASLTRYGSVVTYDIGSHHGRAVLSLQVTSPGKFTVTVTGTPSAGADLAFGGSLGSGIVGSLLPAIPLMILGFLGTLTLFIVRLARKRSLQSGPVQYLT